MGRCGIHGASPRRPADVFTPVHGHLRNLAPASIGRLDAHLTALRDGGPIKFWSRQTLSALLQETGFEVVAFRGAGRRPWLWKSMLIAARKPGP